MAAGLVSALCFGALLFRFLSAHHVFVPDGSRAPLTQRAAPPAATARTATPAPAATLVAVIPAGPLSPTATAATAPVGAVTVPATATAAPAPPTATAIAPTATAVPPTATLAAPSPTTKAAPVATAALAAQAPAPATQSYTVQRGDTVYSIARRHGTTVDALVAANHLATGGTVIAAGQTLVIPGTGTP